MRAIYYNSLQNTCNFARVISRVHDPDCVTRAWLCIVYRVLTVYTLHDTRHYTRVLGFSIHDTR